MAIHPADFRDLGIRDNGFAAEFLLEEPGRMHFADEVDDVPETVIAAPRRVHRACGDRKKPRTRDRN